MKPDVEIDTPNPDLCFYGQSAKIKIGPKKLVIKTRSGDELSFQRRVREYGSPDHLMITVRQDREEIVKEKCSLGHDHHVKKKVIHEWGNFQIEWQYAESLMEWFQQGTWREVRSKKLKNQ